MRLKAPPELEFKRKASSFAFKAKQRGSAKRSIFGENVRVFKECLEKEKCVRL